MTAAILAIAWITAGLIVAQFIGGHNATRKKPRRGLLKHAAISIARARLRLAQIDLSYAPADMLEHKRATRDTELARLAAAIGEHIDTEDAMRGI